MWRVATIAGPLVLAALALPAVRAAASERPSLGLSVVTDAGFARPGGLLSYGIRVRNRAATRTDRVTVLSRLARGTAVVDLSSSDQASCRETRGSVACTLPGLAARQTAEIWITTVVRAKAAGTLHTRVTARTPGFRDAAATVATPVIRGADLALRLHAVSYRRRVVTLTTVVRNRGLRRARGVVLHLGLGHAAPLRYRGALCRTKAGVYLGCPLGPLGAGARRTVRLTVRLPHTGLAEVAASVTPDLGDPNPADNTALTTVHVHH
jgi:hypothetical protein